MRILCLLFALFVLVSCDSTGTASGNGGEAGSATHMRLKLPF
jgi:hypothetical protein